MLRSSVRVDHARTASNYADLLIGVWLFLDFAVDAGALTPQEASRKLITAERQLKSFLVIQDEEQKEEKVVTKFLTYLGQALASGYCHLVDRLSGEEPTHNKDVCGWRLVSNRDPNGELRAYHIAQGPCIGLYDDLETRAGTVPGATPGRSRILFYPDAAQKLVESKFGSLGVTKQALRRSLDESGAMVKRDDGRYTTNVTVDGRTKKFLALYADLILIAAPATENDPDYGDDAGAGFKAEPF